MTEHVNHPRHYVAHTSGVEAIELCEWLSFNTGNALKYVWRAGHKGRLREDLQKSLWYINREHTRILNGGTAPGVPHDFVERAQRVVQHEPKNSLLSVVLMQVALPRWITLEHLDNARWHLAAEIAAIVMHLADFSRLGETIGRNPMCEVKEPGELTDNDDEVTCPKCRRIIEDDEPPPSKG